SRRSVVLPQPLGPSSVTNSRSRISRLSSRTAATEPYDLDTHSIEIPAMPHDRPAPRTTLVHHAGPLEAGTGAAQPRRQPDGRADDDQGHDGEGRHRSQVAGLVEVVRRDRQGHGARAEEQDRRAQLLNGRYEHQKPSREESGAGQRKRDASER